MWKSEFAEFHCNRKWKGNRRCHRSKVIPQMEKAVPTKFLATSLNLPTSNKYHPTKQNARARKNESIKSIFLSGESWKSLKLIRISRNRSFDSPFRPRFAYTSEYKYINTHIMHIHTYMLYTDTYAKKLNGNSGKREEGMKKKETIGRGQALSFIFSETIIRVDYSQSTSFVKRTPRIIVRFSLFLVDFHPHETRTRSTRYFSITHHGSTVFR